MSHGFIKIQDIDTLIIDECHHVIGNKKNISHPYSVIMDKYWQYKNNLLDINKNNCHLPRIMGLTASPIKTYEKSGGLNIKIEQLQRKMDAKLMRVENDELKQVTSNPIIKSSIFINGFYQ